MVDRALYRRNRDAEGNEDDVEFPLHSAEHRLMGLNIGDEPEARPAYFACGLRKSLVKQMFSIFGFLIVSLFVTLLYFNSSDSTDKHKVHVSYSTEIYDLPEAHALVDTDSTTTTQQPTNVCRSKLCQEAAQSILESLDLTVNPCHNFYKFVCGNCKKSKITKILLELESHLNNLINGLETLIKIRASDYLVKIHQYYNSCLTDHLVDINDLKKKFDEIGGWPMWNNISQWNETQEEWMSVLGKFYEAGSQANYLLDIRFSVDTRNRTKMMMMIDSPIFYVDKENLVQGLKNPEVQNYMQTMINVTRLLKLTNVEKDIEEVISFEVELAKIVSDDEYWDTFTIKHMQSLFPDIQWLELLNSILSPYVQITDEEEVSYSMPYIKKFHELMTKRKPSNRVLANFLFWRTVFDLGVENLSDPTPRGAELLKQLLDNISYRQKRMAHCAELVRTNMGYALGSLFVQNIFKRQNVKVAKVMSENIHSTFYQMIEQANWLDEDLHVTVLNKILMMDIMIGYPPEIVNETVLEDYYRDLDMSSSKYFINVWNFQRFQWIKNVEEFARPRDNKDWTGPFGKVSDLIAAYFPQNVIYVTAGIMHKLLFDSELPNYMNYAMLGEILGHEMSHALSSRYKNFDEHGNTNYSIWSKNNNIEFRKRNRCFINKYNNYIYPEYNLRVNGRTTLDENVADITGLKAAYDSYISLMTNKTEEPRLPGLENFNSLQMFWVAYASMYCDEDQSKSSIQFLIESDSHAPDQFRVIGAVSGIPGFVRDFHCHPKDLMYPKGKFCHLWF